MKDPLEAPWSDLSRPRDGENNTVHIGSHRYMKLHSKKFICPACQIFCGELIPIVRSAVVRAAKARGQKGLDLLPRTKIYCFNGCHFKDGWGWKDFNWGDIRARDSIKEWPEEFRNDKEALEKEKRVRSQRRNPEE